MVTEEQRGMLWAAVEKMEESNRRTHMMLGDLRATMQQVAEAVSALVGSVDHGDFSEPATTALVRACVSPSSTTSGKNSRTTPITTDDPEHEISSTTNSEPTTTSPASLMPSPTSALSHDVALTTSSPPDGVVATLAAATVVTVVAPTRCSTPGLYQAAGVLASPSPSSTSSSLITRERPQVSPARCSTPGLSRDTCNHVLVAASAPSPGMMVMIIPAPSSPAWTMAPSIPAVVQTLVPASSPSLVNGDYSINLSAKSSRYITVTIPNSSQASVLLVGVTTKYRVHVMFEMLPEQELDTLWLFPFMHHTNLLLPHYIASCVFNFNLDMVLRPAWPPPIQMEVEKDGFQNGPKPPWLLFTDVSSSWSEKIQLINGFLLEATPWLVCWVGISSNCRACALWMLLWKTPVLLLTWFCSMNIRTTKVSAVLIDSKIKEAISTCYALPEYATRKCLGAVCGLIHHLIVSLRQDQGDAFSASSGVVLFQLLHADDLVQFLQGDKLQYDFHSTFAGIQITHLSSLGCDMNKVSVNCISCRWLITDGDAIQIVPILFFQSDCTGIGTGQWDHKRPLLHKDIEQYIKSIAVTSGIHKGWYRPPWPPPYLRQSLTFCNLRSSRIKSGMWPECITAIPMLGSSV